MGALLAVIAVSTSGFVAPATVDAQIANSDLILEAEIVSRSETSAELSVIEVFKGDPGGPRVRVNLERSFACDISPGVPARGRGLWLLRRQTKGWVITNFGRAFFERSTADDGRAVALTHGRILVPRSWVVGRGENRLGVQLDWDKLVAKLRAAVSPTPRYASARWVLQRYDCGACELDRVRADLRDAGFVDYGSSDSVAGRTWQQERLVAARSSRRPAQAVFAYEHESEAKTLVTVERDGGVVEVVVRSNPADHPFCRQPILEWQRCDSATTPGSECLEPIPLDRCVPVHTVVHEEPLPPSTRLEDGVRLGDWAPAGKCVREAGDFLFCVPEGGDELERVVTP